jgi:hypothetical protein
MVTINGHRLIEYDAYPNREPAFRTLNPETGMAHCCNCTAKGNDLSLTQCPASNQDHGLLTWSHRKG